MVDRRGFIVCLAVAGLLALPQGVLADGVEGSVDGQEMPESAAAVERVSWDGTPIRVVVPVDGERLVRFPGEQIRVGVPVHLEDRLRVFSNEGIAYFQAHAAFGPTRVVVEELGTGRAYFLDLVAEEDPTGGDVVVHRRDGEPGEAAEVEEGDPHQNLDYIALTRFAAQQLYAPSRLRPEVAGVRQVSLDTAEVDLVRGGAVAATPLAAWRGGGYYVTAVRLTNRTREPVVLDPRDIRGEWLAATFQHARLQPAGDEADTTAVYLVSRRQFEDSFWGAR
ncbi:TIGR03749 family integrating conjugative element protein [Aquisalimonas asiatica]|uniref:Integrating conjugative element protein, PFL_4704 family n=1 Tax=Aquisalimonas asiatica TaxID=406100 RepID=A0A1H8VQS0_9GAMM|nr:TIGR03749 family integrating conjugative element protein [Aquisalimonas asiatica]SEP17776.1 integrating conjugative element protein, PFL_4704 family [Aquisalimonas asiatica]